MTVWGFQIILIEQAPLPAQEIRKSGSGKQTYGHCRQKDSRKNKVVLYFPGDYHRTKTHKKHQKTGTNCHKDRHLAPLAGGGQRIQGSQTSVTLQKLHQLFFVAELVDYFVKTLGFCLYCGFESLISQIIKPSNQSENPDDYGSIKKPKHKGLLYKIISYF
ncbi:MAG: hypothetical protein E2O77_07185 [Caldithrix sp.]|nr:MAG: hypothetical protein E2O77_07185 [Caldithrix sp.]